MELSMLEALVTVVKLLIIFLMMVNAVPFLVWLERRGSAFIQNRFGPNRIGPFGLVQTMADAIKFAFKEEFVPSGAKKIFFYAAPVISLIPAALAMGALPFSVPIELEALTIQMQGYEFGAGLIIVLGVSSLSAYSLLLAGWSSGNKFSLMGALRASAQMISYELGLGLSLVGILMIYGTFNFNEMIEIQKGVFEFNYFGKLISIPYLPNWGIFYQPLGALLFLVCLFAESNRLPFDLPEAEAELVAGYHTEYGGLKMLMFYIGEYGHMIVGASLTTIIFFGGYDLVFINEGNLKEIFLKVQPAPSWCNIQPWRFVINEKKIYLFLAARTLQNKMLAHDNYRGNDYGFFDLGIAMCHFHIAAEELNYPGKWILKNQLIKPLQHKLKVPDNFQLVAIWE